MIKIALILNPAMAMQRQLRLLSVLQSQAHHDGILCTIELVTPPIQKKYHLWICGDKFREIYLSAPPPELILSLNAGYHDFQERFNHVKVMRAIHPLAPTRMARYVAHAILSEVMQTTRWTTQQKEKSWNGSTPHFNHEQWKVGILGLGVFGMAIARSLLALGFSVEGYQRNTQHPFVAVSPTIETLISRSNVLINVLPDTQETKNILDLQKLELLPKDSLFINVGRGAQVNETDLLSLIENRHIYKAILDVFSTEPLPESHPFWTNQHVILTPHISGAFDVFELPEMLLDIVKTSLNCDNERDN